jgi:DUF4097 and DUF4098 domain-containing protein YvlB
MRTQSLAALAICALAGMPCAARSFAAERQTIDKTFELSAGASVEVSSIAGPVVVEVSDSGTAEVHVVRTAPSQAEFDCAPMIVEGSADHLVVRVEQQHGSGCRNSRRTDAVRLRLPASVNFKASSVAGDVTIGRLEGTVDLNSIAGDVRLGGVAGRLDVSSVSGRVEVEHAAGRAKISSVSGPVVVAITELGEGGIDASSISGDVEFRFSGNVDADVTVDSISGDVSSNLPSAHLTKTGESSFRMRLGSGGTRISLSSISGDVRFTSR